MTDIHPCSCETCDNVGCKAHPSNIPATDAGLYGAFSRLDQEATWRITSWFGCASHPQAREYLMRDVIKTLEFRATKLRSEAWNERAYMKSARAAGIEEAIALIKGGKA